MKKGLLAIILFFISILIAAQQKPVITVLDFRTSGVSESEMLSITSLISNTLFNTGKYTVIDLAQREALLKEIEFSLSDCVDDKCQIEIGKQLSAELIVVGSIDKVGDNLVLTAKVLETKTALTKSVADGKYSDLNKLLQNISELGLQLAGVKGPLLDAGSVQEGVQDNSDSSKPPEPPGFIIVESGTFTMGNPGKPYITNVQGDDFEKPLHPVTISRSFYMSRYEVTQEEWRRMMGTNPSRFMGDDRPVDGVTWFEAIEYCNRLSQREGFAPCYLGSGNRIVCNFLASGYRLPTEAEWEYAAQGGKKGRDYRYSASNDPRASGWYFENSGASTHPVGRKQANELGLYDMFGNVMEWCWDVIEPYASALPLTDPKGPAKTAGGRVLRGGSWALGQIPVRARNTRNPTLKYGLLGARLEEASQVGFRVVRTIL